jgi:hypothetical protein
VTNSTVIYSNVEICDTFGSLVPFKMETTLQFLLIEVMQTVNLVLGILCHAWLQPAAGSSGSVI